MRTAVGLLVTCALSAAAVAAPLESSSTEFAASELMGVSGPGWSAGTSLLAVDVFRWNGAFLAWYKLLLIMGTYLLWVKLSSRMNQDLLRFGSVLKMSPAAWNGANVGSFVGGLLAALLIPWFWVGWPLMAICAGLPWFLYRSVRQTQVRASSSVAFQVDPNSKAAQQALPQDEGADIQFVPAGATGDDRQRQMILARRSSQFVTLKNLMANALVKRADVVMLDYTAQIVNVRLQIDGAWHPLPELQRADGDELLVAAKHLAGLNPADRRSRQQGTFQTKFPAMDLKTGVEVLSQGVATGERVQIKVLRASAKALSLEQLGMWPEMAQKLVQALNQPGLVIISGPPRGGLTTTWRSSLLAMDRFTRDCVGILEAQDRESDVENIVVQRFNDGESPAKVLRQAVLTQPNCLVVPNPVNAAVLDSLTAEALQEDRSIVTRVHAQSAAEALLKLWTLAGNKDQFIQAVTMVTGQRMFRKLCNECKQAVPVKPDFVKRLGGKPSEVNQIYNAFVPPPNPVDEEGKPIEIPICQQCQGYGYFGRAALFESLSVNDSVRQVLATRPELAAVAEISRRSGNLDQTQEAYRLVLAGVTSLDEVKRVFQKT